MEDAVRVVTNTRNKSSQRAVSQTEIGAFERVNCLGRFVPAAEAHETKA